MITGLAVQVSIQPIVLALADTHSSNNYKEIQVFAPIDTPVSLILNPIEIITLTPEHLPQLEPIKAEILSLKEQKPAVTSDIITAVLEYRPYVLRYVEVEKILNIYKQNFYTISLKERALNTDFSKNELSDPFQEFLNILIGPDV